MLRQAAVHVLRAPQSAGGEATEALERGSNDAGSWLLLFAALNLVRPDLVTRTAVARLADLFRRADLTPAACRLAGEVCNQLLTTSHAAAMMDAVLTVLREREHSPTVYEVLTASLRYAASWAEQLLDAGTLAALAAMDHLHDLRAHLIRDVMERVVLSAGEAAPSQEAMLSPYCLYYLRGKEGLPASVRAGFPLHEQAADRLGQGSPRVLIVHNISDRQGDEVVRCVPLLQALLDFNPGIEIVLVTRRLYLYAHPRITAVPIGDRQRVNGLLSESFDVVIDFFERVVRTANHDPELEERVQAYVRERKPFLFLCSTKGFNHFLFETAEVDGQPFAGALALDRLRVQNTYETTCRLIAELGLPLRRGEEAPRSEWVLAGLPWPEAEKAWSELMERNRAQRPVALLSPFGGVEPLKGHQRAEGIAAEIQRLAAEGFFVIVMPNGTPWGAASAVREAMLRLSAGEREQVEVAPDPSGTPDHADHVMRLATYFVRFSDLVVTVEGWMMHEAYCLGRPFRVLMLPYSHSDEWHPYCRTCRQGIYPAAWQSTLAEGEAPLAEQPRKFTLLCVLRELGEAGIEEALPFLRRALRSPDRHVRLAAARSLGRYGVSVVEDDLTALLEDPSHEVRAAAAEALLARAPGPQRAELMVHIWIGQENRNWASVYCAGEAARRAVETATRGDDPVVVREAEQCLRMLGFRAGLGGKSSRGRSRFRPLKMLSRVAGR